ncbi:MAG: ComEC/Rec2 family competence protein, partial [Chthoniobacterales bacterium]
EVWRAPLPLVCVFLALGAVVSLIRPRAGLIYLLVGASFFALHLEQEANAPGRELSTRLGDRARPVTITGMVASEPKITPNDFTTFLLRLDSIDLGGHQEASAATVQVRWKGNPQLGDQIRLRGLMETIPPPRNPGEFDLRAYLARRDVHNSVFARYPEDGAILETGSGGFVRRSAARVREWMRATLTRGLEDSPEVAALINGMALGLRHETPDDIEEPFQQTGTLHLFAVAGLHVGIVAQLLWILALLVRLPRKAAAALIIPCLFFYSAITGFHVSSVRAATMAAVLLGGIFFDRPVLALNSLAGAALLILAVDPNQLFSSGFQLSFAVVAAILILADPISRMLIRLSEPDPFLPRVLLSPGQRIFQHGFFWSARATSVSTAAWIGSLILIIWYFYLITPISLLANLTVVPVAFCVLAVGLMSLVAAPFSTSLSLVFNNANWSLAKIILGLVHFFATLPAGHIYVERPRWPTGARAEITVLDAGAGAAVHLRAGGADWLFDSGSARDYERFLRDYLHSRGIDRLDGLFLSHGDSTHIGGALAVCEEFKPRRVIDNGAPDRSRVHQVVRQQRTEIAARNSLFRFSRHVSARVLFPVAGFPAKAADDQALVVQLIIDGKFRVLLVSDSGRMTEETLLAHPEELKSDVLIKGQHHTGESGSAEFLAAVNPQLIVATSRDFPARERISEDWARRVQERGITLFRQDQTGAVDLEFFRNEWRATSFLGHSVFRSTSP